MKFVKINCKTLYKKNSPTEDHIVEPRLKYSRVPNYAKEIISKDSISCLAVHAKFILIGTDWGNIYILDHLGNQSSKKLINAHSTTINQISIDSTGEYIASCSNDGKVIVNGLLDDKTYPMLSFNQPIKAIAISPDFKRTSQFITGDSRLLLVSKGLLTTHKYKVLQENRTVIRNIKWNDNIVIYATDESVYVFEMKEQKLIGIIDPDKMHLVSNINEFYCRIFWINHEKFLIGWGHLVQICIIKDNPNFKPLMQLEFSSVNKLSHIPKKVESLHSFVLQDLILGVVPYDKYILAVIDPVPDPNDSKSDSKPQPLVVILEPDNSNKEGFIELTYEQIALKDYKSSKFYNIHLDKIPYENEFYIVSSKDLIYAKEREIDDRIEWLIQNKLFSKALDLVQQVDSNVSKYTYKKIGLQYAGYLFEKKEFVRSAEIYKSILDDRESWQNCIKRFLSSGCVEIILPCIPITEDLKLSEETYTCILENQFNQSLTSFLHILKTWPPTLYSITKTINIINKNRESLSLVSGQGPEKFSTLKNRERIMLECLGILYEHNQDFEKSLDCYFKLENSYIYTLIIKRKMFEFVKERLVDLFKFNRERTLSLLMDYINDISPETIVQILSPTPMWLYNYLHTLVSNNVLASEPYHLKMVYLYAEFKPESLLSFLKSSDKYDLNAAIKLCESKKLNKEVIYLLGRIGKSKEALQMIMCQDNSVFEAIDYCYEKDDDDLWQKLISFSSNKPEFIKAILENSGMDINVKSFIGNITRKIEIPGLKDSLVVLLINNEKRNNLIHTHQAGKWEDIFEMIKKRFQYSTRPIICDVMENKCVICYKPIANCVIDFVLFPCSHFCHLRCLGTTEIQPDISCYLCNDS